MFLKEHIKPFLSFWSPSVARRITFYFFIFGLIIFIITSFIYLNITRKKFISSTSGMIKHQVSLIERSNEADFIWDTINAPNPELYKLFHMLKDISSSFYNVTDISIYVKDNLEQKWYRLFFKDNNLVQIEPLKNPSIESLERNLRKHFSHEIEKTRSNKELSLFVNISKENDHNTYFLKIGISSESMAAIMRRELQVILFVFIFSVLLSRFLGYYFARKISRPIENLTEISASVAQGDLSKLAPISSRDEFGELAGNFNKMIEGLREREKIKVIEFELEKGRKIQKEFLPSQIPYHPNWEIATCFYPAGMVSGDFYDVFMLPGSCMGLVIADVCDKGVGSALYMALFRSLIRVFSEQALTEGGLKLKETGQHDLMTGLPPATEMNMENGLKAVSFTNNYIANNHGNEGMFATLFFGVLNPSTGKLCYINGGHEPLFVINGNGIKHELKATGPAVGLMPDSIFKTRQINLDMGDLLIGYTDGVTDARSPVDEMFTRNRFRELLSQRYNSAFELLESIKASLFSFIDAAPRWDDVTMLAVRRITS